MNDAYASFWLFSTTFPVFHYILTFGDTSPVGTSLAAIRSFEIFSLYHHAQAKQYQCCPGYICSFTCETLSIPAGLSEPWPPAIDYDLITNFNKHKICTTATWNECRFPTASSKSNWMSNLFFLECGEQRCGFWSLFPQYQLEMGEIKSEALN